MNTNSKKLFTVCLFLGLVFVIVYTPSLRRASYDVSLDVISYDNFYDIENKEFQGETQTLSNVGFKFEDFGDSPIIESFFSVHTLQGDVVVDVDNTIAVTRDVFYRDIEVEGGQQYILDSGVFKKPDSVLFRQPNYSDNTEYLYDGDIFSGGIKLHKYVARFDSDQTEALSQIDAVSKRGNRIVTSVNSELWFEPVSGRLVNYKEDSIAYEVDSKTGRIIQPWNHFRNSVSESGVAKQISKAKEVRDIVLVVYAIYSALLFLFGYLILRSGPAFSLFRKKGYKIDILIVMLVPIAFFTYYYIPKGLGEVKKVAVLTWSDATLGARDNIDSFIANIKEYEDSSRNRIEVDMFTSESNRTKAIKEIDLIVAQGYDLIMVVSDPAALLVRSYVANIPVVFTDVSHPLRLGLIDSYVSSGNNFVGVVSRVSAQSQVDFFREIQPELESLHILQNSEDIALYTKEDFSKARVNLNSVSIVTEKTLREKKFDSKKEAIYLPCDFSLLDKERVMSIVAYSYEEAIPLYSCQEDLVLQGATAGLIQDSRLVGSIAGQYAGRILSGVSPTALETVLPPNAIRFINQTSLSKVGGLATKRLLETSKVVKSN